MVRECWEIFSSTVASGKCSRLVLLAEALRPSDSHEAAKPQSDCSPSPVREKDMEPYPKD